MEVKVDPGSETNCIPLSHFRHLFPQLCKKDGLPKETVLEPTLAQFEAYDGGVMQAHGWIIMPIQNISNHKFHPVRYYMVERENAWILISHSGPPHPPKEKYSLKQLTIRRPWKSQQELRRQLQPATVMGGNDVDGRNFTGRKTGLRSIQLYNGQAK